MISDLRQLGDVLVDIDRRLGLKRFLKYLIIIVIGLVLVPILKHPKTAIKGIVRFFIEISEEIEGDKMKERDLIIQELSPLLRELRAETEADRVVYYEYHNSIKNEAGIPFKFVDLVQQASKPGLPELGQVINVNVSRFAELYCDIRDFGIVINKGAPEFYYKYTGFTEIANGSRYQIFVNIPGINFPLGILVLEWYDDDAVINWEKVKILSVKESLRINALMSKIK